MEKRVKFIKGQQKEFLLNSRKELDLTWFEFANEFNIKTLEKSYRYEFCSLPLETFSKILKLKSIRIKDLIGFSFKIEKRNEYGVIGRRVLGEKRIKLKPMKITYKNRKSSLQISSLNLSAFDLKKSIKLPEMLTSDLAEEIGIHLGDGFLSDKKYEYRLKGNKDEMDYYNFFIRNLYKNLFNLNVNVKEYETTYGFEIYSKGIWEFKTKLLKIPPGKKNDISVPNIVKVNDINILSSFIRGIFDTDGCVRFKSTYGFEKHYPVIEMAMLPKKLVFGILEILNMLGFEPYLYQDKKGYWHIVLNGYERIERYSKLIGWNNPKHLKKVTSWKENYPNLGKNVVINKNQNLFKLKG